MWERIKSACLHSLTMAWGYLIAAMSALLQFTDPIAGLVGDEDFKAQVHAVMGDTKMWSYVALVFSIITILCRVRSIGKGNG